jgi:large conductance mechanosensitive channel
LLSAGILSLTKQKKTIMGFISEFKAFALKGNVIDLAIGIVIGAAFGKIVSSLVDDILTPAILTPALKAAKLSNLSELVIPGTAIKYGNFLSQVIAFLIIAIALFMVIKAVNKFQKKQPVAEPVEVKATKEEMLLTEIRDLLAVQKKGF